MLNDKKVTAFLDDFFKSIKKIEERHQMIVSFDNIQYLRDTIKAKMTCVQGKPLPYYTKSDFAVGEVVRVVHKDIDPTQRFTIVKINRVNIRLSNDSYEYSCPPQWLQKL